MIRSDRSISLFYSLLQAKCRDRSPTAGTTLTVILLETFFYLLLKIISKRARTCRINTVRSHINRGRKSTKYLNICNSYNYVYLTFYILYIYKSTTSSAQFCPLYIPHRTISSSPSTRTFPIHALSTILFIILHCPTIRQ